MKRFKFLNLLCLFLIGSVIFGCNTTGHAGVEDAPGAAGGIKKQGGIPAGYRTGKWPVYPQPGEAKGPLTIHSILLASEPQVTMIDEWKASITFTTFVPTGAATVYYGIYIPGELLPWPRFLAIAREDLTGQSTQHNVEIDIAELKDSGKDITGLKKNNGGVIAYRIELYSFGTGLLDRIPKGTQIFDRRFQFYKNTLVPTIIEGPFVDQVTGTGAVISWRTDKPVKGTVNVWTKQGRFNKNFPVKEKATRFEVALTGLAPGKTYYYQVLIPDRKTSPNRYYFKTPGKNTNRFSFAVMGDGRQGVGGGEQCFNGVNAYVLRRLTTDAFNKGSAFIVHTGDLIQGYLTDPQEYKMQLQAYKDVVEPVGAYIPIYEMMGNHEILGKVYMVTDAKLLEALVSPPALIYDLEGPDSTEAIFADEFVNPKNGPKPDNKAAGAPQGKSLPPYSENVYFVDYGNCRLIMMNNNYWHCGLPEKYGGNLEGYILDDQMKWIKKWFIKTKNDKSIKHLFILAHEPMFPNVAYGRSAMWYSGGAPGENGGYDRRYVRERRDEILKGFIATGKAVAAVFSHEHNYTRMLIPGYINPGMGKDGDFKAPPWQIVSGGAGAPFYIMDTAMPWSRGVVEYTCQFNYVLFKVEKTVVTMETYNSDGILIDSANLTKKEKKR